MSTQQILKCSRPHCRFFNEECHGTACPAFIAYRPISDYERKGLLFSDIPVIRGVNDTISDWCSRYDIRVAERNII